MQRALAAGLVVALLAPGCLSTLAPGTAGDRLPLARQAAAKWSRNATLAGVLGTEGSLQPQAPEGQEDATPTVPADMLPVADGDVGDGEGLLWFYAFVAPDEEGILGVASGPGVGGVRTGEHTGYDLDPLPEGALEEGLDSDEAIQAAREANASFHRAAGGPHGRLYYELHAPENGSPAWRIYASPDPAEPGWSARVDASTGEVTVEEGVPDWGWEDPRDRPGAGYGQGTGERG